MTKIFERNRQHVENRGAGSPTSAEASPEHFELAEDACEDLAVLLYVVGLTPEQAIRALGGTSTGTAQVVATMTGFVCG